MEDVQRIDEILDGITGASGRMYDSRGEFRYGDRIPTHEDINAITALLPQLPWGPKTPDDHAELNAAVQMIAQVIVSYCRQFRDVAGTDKEG